MLRINERGSIFTRKAINGNNSPRKEFLKVNKVAFHKLLLSSEVLIWLMLTMFTLTQWWLCLERNIT